MSVGPFYNFDPSVAFEPVLLLFIFHGIVTNYLYIYLVPLVLLKKLENTKRQTYKINPAFIIQIVHLLYDSYKKYLITISQRYRAI